MTNEELDKISKEINCISQHLSMLDPDDVHEHKLREQLFQRWDFLDHQMACALMSAKRRLLRIVVCNNH